MLHVFACCWELLLKVLNRSNFWVNNSQHFFCSRDRRTWHNDEGSVSTALPTLLGPRTPIAHGLLGDSNAITSSDRPTSQHRANIVGSCCIRLNITANFQHCWLNNVGSCCVRLNITANFQHCWLNNVGSCCVRLHLAWYPNKRVTNNSLYSFNRVASPSESSSSESSSDEDDSKPADDSKNKNNIPLDSFVVNIEDEKKEEKDAESVM